MKINAIIVDDELLARKRVAKLLNKCDEIYILGECSNGEDAIQQINDLKPELVFLDIEMKDMNGFDVVAGLEEGVKPIIIFITAFDEFAIKAFEVHAFDYLLKPFEKSRFYEAVGNAVRLINQKDNLYFQEKIAELSKFIVSQNNTKNPFSNKFPVRLGNKISFLDQKNIKYILASGSYPEIQTIDKNITVRDSLSNMIKSLDKNKFVRIHRSVIINIEYVNELIHSSYYELDVKMKDGETFRVSKSYRKSITQKLGLK